MRDFLYSVKANLPLLFALAAGYAGLLALALCLRGGAFSPTPADVVFVFDTTSSMGEEISGALQASGQFADVLHGMGVDCRFGLVTFGDKVRSVHEADGRLTPSVTELEAWLSLQRPIGGEDQPENQLEALLVASRFDFRPKAHKVLILITDAPFHDKNDGTGICNHSLQEVEAVLQRRGLVCFVVGVPLEGYLHLAESTGGQFFDIHSTRNFGELLVKLGYALARSVLD